MRVEQFLRQSARRYADKVAVIAGPVRLSFGEIDAASDRLAAALVSGGVERHDRVVVLMENCIEAVISIFAVFKAGAVLSPVNPSTKADKLAFILNNARATAILTQKRFMAVADRAVEQAPSVVFRAAAGTGDTHSAYACFEDIVGGSETTRSAGSGNRDRSRNAHLHIGFDRVPEGRDDDAPERDRRRGVHHDLSGKHA